MDHIGMAEREAESESSVDGKFNNVPNIPAYRHLSTHMMVVRVVGVK